MPDIWYDYLNCAWVREGLYSDCHHAIRCNCYGRRHKGHPPDQEALAAHQVVLDDEAAMLALDN